VQKVDALLMKIGKDVSFLVFQSCVERVTKHNKHAEEDDGCEE
jgi:hypothetical protein